MNGTSSETGTARCAIGDVHGRPFWKTQISTRYKEIYIVGDYFDSFDIPFSRQYNNFTAICEAARKDSRIKLCLGNHDYQYLRGVHNQQYSGFQYQHFEEIGDVLEENIDLLKIVYVTKDNYIISHAGVTAWFLNSINGSRPEDINSAFDNNRNVLNFHGFDIYGDDITQSPIWVRPGSLKKDPLPGYSQIVGHTQIDEITETNLKGAGKLVMIDTGEIDTVYRF